MGEESECASLEKCMIISHVGIIVMVRITKKDLRSKSIELTYYIDCCCVNWDLILHS
jgi:hypothetical protein